MARAKEATSGKQKLGSDGSFDYSEVDKNG